MGAPAGIFQKSTVVNDDFVFLVLLFLQLHGVLFFFLAVSYSRRVVEPWPFNNQSHNFI
jgi:hypothetical protein